MNDLWRFLKLFRPVAGWAAFGIVLSLATVLANIGLMALSGWFVAAMGIAGAAGVSMNYFTPAAGIRALAIVRTVGRYGERLVTHDATLRMTARFRTWFYTRLEPLAPAGLDDLHSGDLLGRMRGDIDTLERFYLNAVVPGCVAILSLIVIGVALALYIPLLAMIEVALLLTVGFGLPLLLHRAGRAINDHLTVLSSQIRIDMTDYLQGMNELLVYGQADRHGATLRDSSDKIIALQDRLHRHEAWGQFASLLCMRGAAVAALAVTAPLVGQATLDAAHLAMVPLLCLACFDAVLPLPAAFQAWQAAKNAARRVFEIVDRPVPPRGTSAVGADGFTLMFEDVTFAYNPGGPIVLDHLSLTLEAGGILVVLGPSGAGKTTLTDLALGFRLPVSGRVVLNGVSSADAEPESWLRLFGVAQQHPFLFAGTIRDNLLLARPDASDEALAEACRLAAFDADIAQLPDGLDGWLGEGGVTLSGGQGRRLALARALLKDAPCLVLDEPGEGLDRDMAHKMLQGLRQYARTRNKALILVTHDTAMISPSDAVLRLGQAQT